MLSQIVKAKAKAKAKVEVAALRSDRGASAVEYGPMGGCLAQSPPASSQV